MMLRLQYFFSTALSSKRRKGKHFILGSWQGVNGKKKVKTPGLSFHSFSHMFIPGFFKMC